MRPVSLRERPLIRTGFLIAVLVLGAEPARSDDYLTIRVEDEATGEPVPCARLTTSSGIVHTSDAQGIIAFYEPGLMDEWVYFRVAAEGYVHPTSGLDPGKWLFTSGGGSGLVRLERVAVPPPCASTAIDSLLAPGPVPTPSQYFRIEVVDSFSGRGVPLIEVRSPNATHVSDSYGQIAFFDPLLMGASVTFEVQGHGHALAGDGGAGSIALAAIPGGHATVTVERRQLAQRLYRVTGGGIYRDTVLLGDEPPLAQPVLNAYVTGQDSARTSLYGGRVFWVWGDTLYPNQPTGNRRATAATSELPGAGGLDPTLGVDLDYFVSLSGKAKAMTPPGGASMWLNGLVAVPDASGQERLLALYAKVLSLGNVHENGFVTFDDETELFEPSLVFEDADVPRPEGQAQTVLHDDGTYVYYENGVRVPALAETMLDASSYEAFTPLQADGSIDRTSGGGIRYAWRSDAPPLTEETLTPGAAAAEEVLFGHVVDPDGGGSPVVHPNTSTHWNEYRQRYVLLLQELGGSSSFLGESWYAEADTPMGPLVYARKIVTHDGTSFYNPVHHPFFDQDAGRRIFFEGTYASLFSAEVPTPRYDYNQVMYQLDLDETALRLPVPVYELATGSIPDDFATRGELRPGMIDPPVAFFAPDRPTSATRPVHWSGPSCAPRRLLVGGTPGTGPLFHALPATAPPTPETVPLYEYVEKKGTGRAYSVEPDLVLPGYERAAEPLVRVWRNPLAVTLPITDYLGHLIADAGPDLCVAEARAGSGIDVTLDGSASRAPSDPIVAYEWSWDADGTVSGQRPRIHLTAGIHSIQLTVYDEGGGTRSDEVVVRVAASGGRQCADGVDNDGDGDTDFPADPGCQTQSSTIENPACDDDIDNDGDGDTDWDGSSAGGNADSDCVLPFSFSEAPSDYFECGLGVELVLVMLLLGWLRGLRPPHIPRGRPNRRRAMTMR